MAGKPTPEQIRAALRGENGAAVAQHLQRTASERARGLRRTYQQVDGKIVVVLTRGQDD